MNETTIKFRYVPCIFFHCIRCDHIIQVERSMPDVTATGVDCQGCHNIAYRVVWGTCPDDTNIEVKWAE